MVAMTPLITIQIMGLIYQLKQKRTRLTGAEYAYQQLEEDAIIDL